MKRILLIEDDEALRGLLREALQMEGYEVIEASDGQEGLRHFLEMGADMVITDIIMPKKEGVETIMELRRRKIELPILAISGGGKLTPYNYLPIAKAAGAQRTLAKPFDLTEFLGIVRELLQQA